MVRGAAGVGDVAHLCITDHDAALIGRADTKWCSGTVSGKHMHSNGGVLYCRTGAFKKI